MSLDVFHDPVSGILLGMAILFTATTVLVGIALHLWNEPKGSQSKNGIEDLTCSKNINVLDVSSRKHNQFKAECPHMNSYSCVRKERDSGSSRRVVQPSVKSVKEPQINLTSWY